MSFTADAKNEIINKNINGNLQKRAFLAGFIRSTASIIKVGKAFGFEYSTEKNSVQEFVSSLFLNVFGFAPTKDESDIQFAKKRSTYQCLGEKAISVLLDLEIFIKIKGKLDLNAELNDSKLLSNEDAKKAFIKGVFVGVGNITLPKYGSKTGYHLGIRFSSYKASVGFISLLETFGVYSSIVERRGFYLIYIKQAEEIKDFLALVNAPMSALKLTELIIEKEVINNVNRAKNCDLANVNKQLDASERHIKYIELIENTVGLDTLGDNLKITALIRRDYPDDSMNELAERLKITKSCLNHRLRKITEIAENIAKEKR